MARRVDDLGGLIWNELQTHNSEMAAAFYTEPLRLEMELAEEGGKPAHATIRHADSGNRGKNTMLLASMMAD